MNNYSWNWFQAIAEHSSQKTVSDIDSSQHGIISWMKMVRFAYYNCDEQSILVSSSEKTHPQSRHRQIWWDVHQYQQKGGLETILSSLPLQIVRPLIPPQTSTSKTSIVHRLLRVGNCSHHIPIIIKADRRTDGLRREIPWTIRWVCEEFRFLVDSLNDSWYLYCIK